MSEIAEPQAWTRKAVQGLERIGRRISPALALTWTVGPQAAGSFGSPEQVVLEAVFVYPGIGQLMVDAVSKRDVPVIQACGLVFALVFVVLNTLADVLIILVNPRLRHQR